MSRGKGSIPIGDIEFYDNVLPLLTAGDYAIDAQQKVDSTDSAHPLTKTFPARQDFSVVAPRFALPPEDVQSVFPPENASGIFDQNLPHVVLKQRVLPWERPLAASGVTNRTPWLALLLLTEDEIIPPAGVSPTTIANPTLVGTYPVTQLLQPPAGTLGPNVTPQKDDEKTCNVVDITTATFTNVTPRLADLTFLAHARQVDMSDKPTSIAADGGWFSTVIANRFPATDPALNGGKRNIVHLVSLEGFAPYLVDNPSWPAGIQRVRLASLKSWSFRCKPKGGSFRELMLALTKDQPKGGNTLRLQLPVTNAAQQSQAATLAQKALQQGYAPLEYETRAGDHSFAWYHGPLLPHPIKSFSQHQPFPNAAAATIYDQTTGTFDLSYAVAWELGRMLALSDRAYATKQQGARRSMRKVVNLVRERTRSDSGAAMLKSANDDMSNLESLLDPKHVSSSFVSWLGSKASENLPRPGLQAKQAPAQSQPLLKQSMPEPIAQVRTLLARKDVRSLLNNAMQREMSNGPMNAVASWLGDLRLLRHVPFANLLADSRMLPADSIRFFYVDDNYLDALCDGATSVGVQSSRDVVQQEVMRDSLRNAAKLHAGSARAKAIGGKSETLLRKFQPGDPVAGFLLRSEVVSGWPGLEVKGYEGATGSSAIDIVRSDHLGPDVLLVLFAKVPARIEISEPKETLAFGVEDNQMVELRFLSGDNIGKVTGRSVALSPTHMRGARVINIDAWQRHLATQLGTPPSWGPAAFAIEMVRAPEQMIFRNDPDPRVASGEEVANA
jgi:hypothetical protein